MIETYPERCCETCGNFSDSVNVVQGGVLKRGACLAMCFEKEDPDYLVGTDPWEGQDCPDWRES